MKLKEKSTVANGGMMDVVCKVVDVVEAKLIVFDGNMFKDKPINDKVAVEKPHSMTDFEVGQTYNMKVVINTYEAHGKTCRGLTLDTFSKASAEQVKEVAKQDEAETMSKDDWTAKEKREYLDKAINTILSHINPEPAEDMRLQVAKMNDYYRWAKDKVDSLFVTTITDVEMKKELDKQVADKESATGDTENVPF